MKLKLSKNEEKLLKYIEEQIKLKKEKETCNADSKQKQKK